MLWLARLRERAGKLCLTEDFPVETIRECAQIENAISANSNSILKFYVWLASGCLTTAFIMTQRSAALRRIETSSNESTRESLLKSIRTGDAFATVGISHLTTSRRHLSQPPLQAVPSPDGWILNGFSPWVTGAFFSDWMIVGAVATNSVVEHAVQTKPNELLFAIPRYRDGVIVEPCNELMALNGSATGPVRFEHVSASHSDVLHGPVENVMEVSSRPAATHASTNTDASNSGKGGAGGLHTSALAIGHSAQAIEYLIAESQVREELRPVAEAFRNQWRVAFGDLCDMNCGLGLNDQVAMRKKANDLALNATQAALVAAKGVGFGSNHDVGRWCREALFFLVWSCPQNVAKAHLCSFMS